MIETKPAGGESQGEHEKRTAHIHAEIEPLNSNRARDRKTWVAQRLWPVPLEELAGYPAVEGDDVPTHEPAILTVSPEVKGEAGETARQSITQTDTDAKPKATSNGYTVRQSQRTEESPIYDITMSDVEILQRAREILQPYADKADRSWYPSRTRKAEVKTSPFAMRCPDELLDQLETLKGSKGKHVERAIRIYLKLIEVK